MDVKVTEKIILTLPYSSNSKETLEIHAGLVSIQTTFLQSDLLPTVPLWCVKKRENKEGENQQLNRKRKEKERENTKKKKKQQISKKNQKKNQPTKRRKRKKNRLFFLILF